MKKKILFLCTHNACRSQMAEGLMRYSCNGRYEVFSAGTQSSEVHPYAIHVMAEANLDISHHRSKSIEEFKDQTFDYVITVCDEAKKNCPVLPGNHKKIHWSISDPEDAQGSESEKMQCFREIRDEIYARVQEFLEKQ